MAMLMSVQSLILSGRSFHSLGAAMLKDLSPRDAYKFCPGAGLEITAGQRTMSGQNRALSGQIRG